MQKSEVRTHSQKSVPRKTAEFVATKNYSYILEDSDENEILGHDSEDSHESNEIINIFDNLFFVNNKTSRRFQIKDRPLKDHKKRVPRTFASRRILGGKQTSIRMHPYNVAISRQGMHWCGGSVIDEQWVLTAGHCMEVSHNSGVEKLSPFVVRAGSSFHNRGGYQARINKAFFPPSYIPGNADYDFSLLRLDRPLPIGRNIAVIDLPFRKYRMVPGDMVVVTGWGSMQKSGRGEMSSRLRFVLVPVVESHRCQRAYRFYISPRMMCAGYPSGGRDACNHDSGGPAVHDGVLVGLVSFGGRVCGDPKSPGVYSRVSEISDWVNYTVHHNEASAVPQLRERIRKARIKDNEITRTNKQMRNKNDAIKNWLRNIIRSPVFLSKVKKRLQAGHL
ncbi:trypsin 3A1-like [Aricia agestis]|uniref:trypsin 3A1-like n=1 Tax=Aricia agestis TaxID=91739 RepID=UPI001C206F20|nr:trypsin 3A1-like [Aricia agestis]